MAYRLFLSPHDEVAIGRFEGVVHGRHLVDAARALFAHPGWEPQFGALWDCRAIRSLLVEPETIEALAALRETLRERRSGGRSAILTWRDMDRAVAALVRHRLRDPERPVEHFTDEADALAFLGLDAWPVHLDEIAADAEGR